MTTNFAETSGVRSGLRLLTFIALAAAASALVACNTTEGFGKDVKHLGSNVEDSAAKNK